MTEPDRQLTEQGEARKRVLMAEAERLFNERGYGATRIIDIVEAAGVAKGLFYWYFPNKEALFRELTESKRRELQLRQMEAIVEHGDPLERLYSVVLATVEFLQLHPRLSTVLEMEPVGNDVFRATRFETARIHHRDTASLLAAGQATGTVRSDDTPNALAAAVLGIVSALLEAQRTGVGPSTNEATARAAARTVLYCVAADHSGINGIIARVDSVNGG